MVKKMGFTAVILNQNEEPLEYLDTETLEIEQTSEIGEIQTLNITYPLDDKNINKTRQLFKIGNKLWVPETNGLDACLYVISNTTKYDYWDKNHIEIELEEVLVELNYVPLFEQDSKAESKTINKNFLIEQFGEYYDIRTVETPLGSRASVKLNGTMTKLELLRLVEEETSNIFRTYYKKDTKTNTIYRYMDFLTPSNAGKTHDTVIDLSFNAENIEYEVDESNTFKAIAPVLSLNEDTSTTTNTSAGSVAQMTRTELQEVIDNWKNLSVTKGATVPMYYLQETDENGKTTYKTGAEWNAPFEKPKGQLYVLDELETGVEYKEIHNRPDAEKTYTTPKIGTIDTSETLPYVIYNKCANTLIDKRYPEIKMEVDLKDLEQVTTGNTGFSLYDRVYVKIPDYDHLIRAEVQKIEKNAQLPGETKISLGNADIGTKINQKATLINCNSTITLKKGGNLTAILRTADETLSNQLCSILIHKDASTRTVQKPVTTTEPTTKTTSKTVVEYDNRGVSKDRKTIMAIGKASAPGDLQKYGYTHYYRSVFKNRCPACGHASLVWGIWWAGKKTDKGYFPGDGRVEGGSIEGHIFCKRANCDKDFSCVSGKDHIGGSGIHLTRVSGPVRSSEAEAQKLRSGKWTKKETTTTKGTKKVTKMQTTTVNDPAWDKNYSMKTDKNGLFKLKVNLSAGTYTCTLNYGGSIEYAACTKKVTLIVK